MILDLTTLYIVILLLSLCMTVIWGALWRTYPTIGGSPFWMLANLLNAIGGIVLSSGEMGQSMLPILAGNALVISGFWFIWCGIRQFEGQSSRWEIAILLGLGTMLALLAVQESRIARNTLYITLQSGALVATAIVLWPRLRGSFVVGMSIVALMAGVAGNLIRLACLAMNDHGWMPTAIYNEVLFATMLASIFSATTLYLGLMLMLIDRLRNSLHSLATIDDLSGLPNRRSFMSRILTEQDTAHARKQTFALMIIDLDRFKQINDTYGHAAGDACLLHFGHLAQGQLRPLDMLARMGGDEFCILLPDTSAEAAAHVAQRLLDAVHAEPAQWRDISMPLTLSIGIADWRPERNQTVSQLLHNADEALYVVKRRGRDGFALAQAKPRGAPAFQPLAAAADD